MRKYLWAIGLLLVVAAGIAVFRQYNSLNKNFKDCSRCNVILVSLDTLSALHMPCYGYSRNTTPNLCAFADKNITFLNSYAQSPRRLDSHFSIFTSLYPHTHKMTDILGDKLSEKYLTLAQIFNSNGYETIYNGPTNDMHLPVNKGIGRGFNVMQGKDRETIDTWGSSYSTLLRNIDNKKPTFIFLHTYMAHEPYFTGHEAKHPFTNLPEYPNIPLTSQEFLLRPPGFYDFVADAILKIDPSNATEYKKILSDESKTAEQLRQASTLREKQIIFNNFSLTVQGTMISAWNASRINYADPQQVEYLKALYDEQILNLDKKLKDLFDLMSDPKVAKSTILIITADQGKEFLEHGIPENGTGLYRTFTQVPLIMYIPGFKKKKVADLVQGIDIYPTVLSLTGLSPKSQIEGINLTGLIRGDFNAPKNKFILSEYRGVAALQEEDNWRFYYDYKSKKSLDLYNLNTDPNEHKNVLSLYPDRVRQYIKQISTFNL